jgi:hypothetical protein
MPRLFARHAFPLPGGFVSPLIRVLDTPRLPRSLAGWTWDECADYNTGSIPPCTFSVIAVIFCWDVVLYMQLLPPPVLCVPAHNVWLLILILIYFPFSWGLYLTGRRFASYPKYMDLARSRDVFCNQARCGLGRPDLSGLSGEHTYIYCIGRLTSTGARERNYQRS